MGCPLLDEVHGSRGLCCEEFAGTSAGLSTSLHAQSPDLEVVLRLEPSFGPSFDMPPEGHQASLVSCDYRDVGAVAIYDSHALLAYLVPSRGHALGRRVPLGEKNPLGVFRLRQYLVMCIVAEYTWDLHPRVPGFAGVRVR